MALVAGAILDQPANNSSVDEHDGKLYVALKNASGVLAVRQPRARPRATASRHGFDRVLYWRPGSPGARAALGLEDVATRA